MKARARPTVCKRCGREYSLAKAWQAPNANATTTATALAFYAVMAVHTGAAAGNRYS